MRDYTKTLPCHIERYVGERDLYLEIFEVRDYPQGDGKRPPLLFVHGTFCGSWMWSKGIWR